MTANDREGCKKWKQMRARNEWEQIKLSDFKFQNEKEAKLVNSIFYGICNYYIFSNKDNL